jgi:hypothetical protein
MARLKIRARRNAEKAINGDTIATMTKKTPTPNMAAQNANGAIGMMTRRCQIVRAVPFYV